MRDPGATAEEKTEMSSVVVASELQGWGLCNSFHSSSSSKFSRKEVLTRLLEELLLVFR